MAALALAPPAAAQADDDVVAEFRRFFAKYDDAATRVEAVLALEGVESVEVVDALVPVLGDEAPSVAAAAVRVLAGFASEPPAAAVAERLADERDDTLVLGLLEVVTRGRYAAATEPVVELLGERDWQLRRQAALATAALAPEGAAERLVPLVEDREVAVRCAALDGLATLRAEAVLAPARAALADESWQVRASAIHALGTVRHVDSIEPLIVVMEVEEGRLIEDAAWALGELTGLQYGLRTDGWRSFWETWKGRYQLPTDEELAKTRAARAANAERYDPKGPEATFSGVETPSRRMLFVIDVSGSMDEKLVEVERYREAGHTAFRRIDVVKRELSKAIEGLADHVEFNILTFATETDAWKKKLVRANVLNKSSAVDFIAKLEPIGGASKQDLHEVGLVGAANLEGGKTNTHLALMTALGVLPEGRRGPDYEVEVDTIFFLSDGLPSMGELVEIEDLLRAVRVENELRRIRLHTLGIGSFQKDFLRRLATENGGRFVDLGK